MLQEMENVPVIFFLAELFAPKGEAVVAVPPAKMRWTIASTARRLGYNVG